MYKICIPLLALCILASGYPDQAYAISNMSETQEAATSASAQFKAFEGNYELQPGFIIHLFKKDDKFFAQATGQANFEIFSESQYVFFAKVAPIKISFALGANGVVSHLILQQGGREMKAGRTQ